MVRERDALVWEMALEAFDVVGPERDVAALERVYGVAGAQAGPGLIAEDLTEVLPKVLRRLYAKLGAGGDGAYSK